MDISTDGLGRDYKRSSSTYLTVEYDQNDKVIKVITGDISSGGSM